MTECQLVFAETVSSLVRRPLKWLGGVVCAVAVGTACTPAGAVPLLVGNSLSVNGLNIEVTACQLALAGILQASCALGNLEIVQIAGPGASIRIQGSGGSDIFSAAAGSGLYDVTFTMDITAISPPTTVNQISMAMVGSVTGSGGTSLTRVSAGENATAPGATGISLSLAGATSGSTTFSSPVSSFSVTKDLKLNTGSIANGDILKLSWVTQSYTPAPEPASIALIGTGLAGLTLLRRRRQAAV